MVKRDEPVEAFNLYRFAIFDGVGEGDCMVGIMVRCVCTCGWWLGSRTVWVPSVLSMG